MREERRIVTALFADVVNSTGLTELLDGEEARLVLNETIAHVIEAIDRYGGTIKDLAGDGVFALFGAPTAHEDDAERALHAALEIIDVGDEKARELSQGWGVTGFGMRVGVHTGDVVLGLLGGGSRVEYGAVGDPVNTAARLQAQAEPGTVLVTDATRRLAEGRFNWAPPVELRLKGKSELVRAQRLLGPASGGTGADGPLTPLAGRDPELRVGREALDALGRGQGSVLFISGEPGIGKSRLLGELRNLALELGIRWHEGRCVSYGESMPYWPYRDLLRDMFGLGQRDPQIRIRVTLQRQLRDLFGERQEEVGAYVADLLGVSLEREDSQALQQLSPESRQFRTFEVMGELIEKSAARQPLVLVLEDVHWADATSIQLTERLLPLVESLPLLLVVSHRSERDHPSWALRETSAREYPHIHREISLRPLAPLDQQSLVTSLTSAGELSEPLRVAILSYAEGNPFFVEQLVRSVTEDRLEVPATIEELILARVDRLPEAAREVLLAATPLGRSFGVSLLEAVSGQSSEEVGAALHQLRRHDLLHEERRWPEAEHRFRHALIQETLYRTLLGSRRRALHARAATWLEERHAAKPDETFALLAHHWRAAENPGKAIRFLELAGDRARELWALDEAIKHYQDLADLLEAAERPGDAAETLFKLGMALHTAMRYGEANAVWQRAFALVPPSPAGTTPASASLRLATSPIPGTRDMHGSISWTDIHLGMALNDRLVVARPNFSIIPGLAEWWEVADDGLRYQFRLRSNARWNDGRSLGADEIEAAIRSRVDPDHPAGGASIFFCLEGAAEYFRREHSDPDGIGVRALDERNLEFRLASPAPYFMNVLNRPDACVSPAEGPGSGAFEIAAMTKSEVRLRRAPGHERHDHGNVGEVTWLALGAEAAAAAFERDEIDLLLLRYGPITGEGVQRLLTSPLPPAAITVFCAFESSDASPACRHLRRALALATDHGRFQSLRGAGGLVAGGGLVPPALPGHTPDIAVRFDPDAARRELTAAGRPPLLRLGTIASWEPIAKDLASQWSEVLALAVRVEGHPSMEAAFTAGCQAMVYNWLPGYPDADYYLRLLLHSQSVMNQVGWSNPTFDGLIDEARTKSPAAARLALYHEADRMAVQDECVMIPLIYHRPLIIAKPWVRGYWEWGKSAASFEDLVVDEELRAGSEVTTEAF